MIRKGGDLKNLATAFLLAFAVTFALVGNCSKGTNIFEAKAQTFPDFPVEQYLWERTGWLIHYDWGFSAYIYLSSNNLYYMIVGGSEFYSIWISLNPTASDGFQINGMSVHYVFSTVGPEDRSSSSAGLYKWNFTEKKWQAVVVADRTTEEESGGIIYHSTDESVAFAANQGKIALSKLGGPQKIWLILEANEAGPIRVPQNGFAYLDITNMFAAVFMIYKEIGPISHPGTSFPPEPKSWVIDRFETANATVLFKNYGADLIQNIRTNISVPPEVNVLSGALDWTLDLVPHENATHTLEINSTAFGTSLLYVSFYYDEGPARTIGPVTLRQELTMIPRVNLAIKAPSEMLLWMQYYPINLTVTNLDPFVATITLSPFTFTSPQEGDVIMLTLNPFANVTLYPKVKVKDSNVGYAASFEGITLEWAITAVTVHYPPDIWVNEVLIDGARYEFGYVKMDMGKMHTVHLTMENEENASCTVDVVLKEGSYWQELPSGYQSFKASYSTQTVSLPPNSNTTVTFDVFSLDIPTTRKYTDLSLTIVIGDVPLRYKEIHVELTSPPSLNPLLTSQAIAVYALMFVLGILGKAIYDKVSSQKRKVKSSLR